MFAMNRPRARTLRTGRARPLGAMLAATAAVLVAASPAAALGGGTPVVVDDFSTNQAALTLTFPPAGTTASSSVSGGGVLGTERDALVNLASGVIAGNSMSAFVSSGAFSYSQSATITGSGMLVWDGIDGSSTIDSTGLGGVDLTAGGTQDALHLLVAFDDLPAIATLAVATDAGNTSTTSFNLPGLIFSNAHFVVPFSALTPAVGAGADLTNVGAIMLFVGSASTAPDIDIDSVQTDALLRAPMTAALTDDVNANTLADPGDEITYTTTISNPDDASDAASAATAFALTPDSDSLLVAGSVGTGQGTVTTGNGVGDTAVAVNIGTIADGASVTITVPVIVQPNPSSPLSAQGTVTSSSLTALRTDDPAVAGTADPTEFAVVQNTTPAAVDDAYAVVGGQTLSVAAPGVLDNDTDVDGDALTAVSPVGPAHGQLTLNADGSFTYTPDAGYSGPGLVHVSRQRRLRPVGAGNGGDHGQRTAAAAPAAAAPAATTATAGRATATFAPRSASAPDAEHLPAVDRADQGRAVRRPRAGVRHRSRELRRADGDDRGANRLAGGRVAGRAP